MVITTVCLRKFDLYFLSDALRQCFVVSTPQCQSCDFIQCQEVVKTVMFNIKSRTIVVSPSLETFPQNSTQLHTLQYLIWVD